MPFNNDLLVKIGGQNQAQCMYSYKTSDAISAVETSGYFNSAVGRLRVDDYIFVRHVSGDAILHVTSGVLPITSGRLLSLPAGDSVTGWASYIDTQYTSAASAFTLLTDTDTPLPNNAGNVIDSQKPTDITTFYDGSVITGRNGDALDIMLYFKAIPSAANQWLDIWVDIGGTIGELYRQTFSFPRGAGIERGVLYGLPSAYTLNTFEANGGAVYVRSNATCDIHSINYNFDRSHKAI